MTGWSAAGITALAEAIGSLDVLRKVGNLAGLWLFSASCLLCQAELE